MEKGWNGRNLLGAFLLSRGDSWQLGFLYRICWKMVVAFSRSMLERCKDENKGRFRVVCSCFCCLALIGAALVEELDGVGDSKSRFVRGGRL